MNGRIASLLACAALALSACDRAADRTPKVEPPPSPAPGPTGGAPVRATELLGPVVWDAKAQAFTFNGRPLRAEKLWTFDGASDGFVPAAAEVTPAPGTGLVVQETGPDSILRTPRGLNVDGRVRSLVIVRLTRLAAGGAWDGGVYYTTAAHGETPANFAKAALGANPQVNQTVTLVYDMHRLRRGEDDWKSSIIDQVRIDLDDTPGGEFIIHQVAIAQDPGGVTPATAPPPAAKAR